MPYSLVAFILARPFSGRPSFIRHTVDEKSAIYARCNVRLRFKRLVDFCVLYKFDLIPVIIVRCLSVLLGGLHSGLSADWFGPS